MRPITRANLKETGLKAKLVECHKLSIAKTARKGKTDRVPRRGIGSVVHEGLFVLE